MTLKHFLSKKCRIFSLVFVIKLEGRMTEIFSVGLQKTDKGLKWCTLWVPDKGLKWCTLWVRFQSAFCPRSKL